MYSSFWLVFLFCLFFKRLFPLCVRKEHFNEGVAACREPISIWSIFSLVLLLESVHSFEVDDFFKENHSNCRLLWKVFKIMASSISI